VVADCDHKKYSVKMIGDMAYGYVPQLTDKIRIRSSGAVVLIDINGIDWLHNKSTWQIRGIIAGSFPEIIDLNGNQAPMTMNGIPIDITDVKVLSALNKLSNYPPDVITEAQHEIHKAFGMFIEEDGKRCMFIEEDGKQNKLYINKSRIKESLHESVTKMVHNHAESISTKYSVKLNFAVLEKAECILTGSNDKEIISLIIDDLWRLINKSSLQVRLQPTHKQEMTSVIMNMRRSRDFGQHPELEEVLNQISMKNWWL
jgi:hypothetical protein